ncbi:IS110 family transposase, partial [Pseudonocardia sp. RS010]|uniref:IS110 family transposase n=1 Tax=Pseudonocardia sp. RS010 TaxID=3385979 RepID=UPI0039A31232
MTHPAVPAPLPETMPVLQVTGGVDTHKDTHTAAALDAAGRLLGHRQFPATTPGYQQLLTWLQGFGLLLRV